MNILRNPFAININYGKDIHPASARGLNQVAIRSLEPANVIMYLVTTLLVIGIIMVYSTSSAKTAEGAGSMNIIFLKHVAWIIIAITGMLIMMKTDYHYLQRYSMVIFIVALAGLIVVLIPEIGAKINGSRRWIRVGFFGYQPSEFAKLAMIIFLSGYIAKNREKMVTFAKGFVVPIILIGVVSLLILKEPDFGTAMFITAVSFILIMVGGTRIIYVIFTLIASIPHIYQIYINKFPAYQHDRLLAFLDPWKDPMGIGYQIIQSWIALGSGGIAGLGLGESRQKLFFLPMSDNDFIFSIIGEEFGFIGTTCIIIMFALFAWQGMRICKAAPDAFGFFLALGITASIALQAAINVAVVTGSIPTKGLPLPFISTGGSSILLSLLGVGILLNIARQSENSDVSACNVEDNRRFVT